MPKEFYSPITDDVNQIKLLTEQIKQATSTINEGVTDIQTTDLAGVNDNINVIKDTDLPAVRTLVSNVKTAVESQHDLKELRTNGLTGRTSIGAGSAEYQTTSVSGSGYIYAITFMTTHVGHTNPRIYVDNVEVQGYYGQSYEALPYPGGAPEQTYTVFVNARFLTNLKIKFRNKDTVSHTVAYWVSYSLD